MRNLLLSSLFLFAIALIPLSFTSLKAEEDVHKDDIMVKSITGNVICLLPNHDKGTVTPVIATEPCVGHGAHAHVILDTRTKEGNVYAVQGSPEAIKRLQMTSNRTNIEVKGKISAAQTGGIIVIE